MAAQTLQSSMLLDQDGEGQGRKRVEEGLGGGRLEGRCSIWVLRDVDW